MIDKIFISTYKKDYHLARIAVASIRFWYDDIPIYLNKDLYAGDFDTSDLEKYFNVKIFRKRKYQKFGNFYSKYEPVFEEEQGQYLLILDSDIVFAGKFLDKFKNLTADLIVSAANLNPYGEQFKRIYFNPDTIAKKIDKDFKPLNYGFNAGQFIIKTGTLTRNLFEPFIDYNKIPPKEKYPDIFRFGDQGLLNYLVHKLEKAGKIKVEKIKMELWPCQGEADFIKVDNLKQKKGYPYIIHWAGCASKCRNFGILRDIFKFYEDFYFQKINASAIKRFFIIANNCKEKYFNYFKNKIFKS